MVIYTSIRKKFGKFYIFLGVGDIPIDGFLEQILLLENFVVYGFPSELQN